MGGFVYDVRTAMTDSASNIDIEMFRFDELPEGLAVEGDEKNLEVKSYLTSDTGECLPMYKFTGSAEDWEKIRLDAENVAGDPNDGHLYVVGSTVMYGVVLDENGVAIGLGEAVDDYEGEIVPSAPQDSLQESDGFFQGFNYDELKSALEEAISNDIDNVDPTSPCAGMVENTVTDSAPRVLAENKTGLPGMSS